MFVLTPCGTTWATLLLISGLLPQFDDDELPWLRDPRIPGITEFDHVACSENTDTLHLISREGVGSARAITAALVMATLSAAEKRADRAPGGRLGSV